MEKDCKGFIKLFVGLAFLGATVLFLSGCSRKEKTASGVVIGGVAGAGIGAAVGGGPGAVIGAVGGGVTGGLIGHSLGDDEDED